MRGCTLNPGCCMSMTRWSCAMNRLPKKCSSGVTKAGAGVLSYLSQANRQTRLLQFDHALILGDEALSEKMKQRRDQREPGK